MLKSNIKSGFSLMEVLVSAFLISVILVLSFPIITKRIIKTSEKLNSQSEAFYYNSTNSANENYCYETSLTEDDEVTVLSSKGKCSGYTYTIPEGIHTIDLTLVAGGGGGGGASGSTSTILNLTSDSDTKAYSGLSLERLSAKIKALISAGESGKMRNNTYSESELLAGPGGASGSAIFNFNVPYEFLKNGYTSNYAEDDTTNSIEVKIYSDDKGGTEDSGKTGIGVKFGGRYYYLNDTDYVTNIGGISNILCNDYDSSPVNETKLQEKCFLLSKNYILPIKGEESKFEFDDSTEISSGFKLEGGAGGRIPNFSGLYGTGGRGDSVTVLCNDDIPDMGFHRCKVPNNNKDSNPTLGEQTIVVDKREEFSEEDLQKRRYGEIQLALLNPAGVGGGGAGGVAVKLNDLQVKPGAKYKIYVGKGGAGGVAGQNGILVHTPSMNTKSYYEKEPTDGAYGASGGSTAIYDENDKLILMVLGGTGGAGGSINTGAEDLPNDYDFKGYAPNADTPADTGYIPIIACRKDIVDKLTFDKTIVSGLEDVKGDDIKLNLGDNIVYKRVIFAYKDSKKPIYELNTNFEEVAKGETITDRKLKNISGYNEFTRKYDKNKASYNGKDDSNIERGLFYRNISPSGDIIYAGGLGGFSGLGTKAGCGGLFVGASSSSNGWDYLKNVMTINTNGTQKTFKVGDLYDNCSIDSPDGHSAEFIMPSYSKIFGGTFGSAGSGGGGGGWSAALGSGKGGDGQDGYVYINWRK